MKQEEKFKENWHKNYTLFGQTKEDFDLDFLFYIEALIPFETSEKIIQKSSEFMLQYHIQNKVSVDCENLSLTIALPGRLGTHFQKNDSRFMIRVCENIFKNMKPIPIKIQNFNVFESVLFTEIYDPTLRLQQLHETICTEIPFSQHPNYRYQHYLPHLSLLYECEMSDKFSEGVDRFFSEIEISLDYFIFGKVKFSNGKIQKKIIKEFRI